MTNIRILYCRMMLQICTWWKNHATTVQQLLEVDVEIDYWTKELDKLNDKTTKNQ